VARVIAAAGLVLVLACVPAVSRGGRVDPENAPTEVWQRLAGLRSFRFKLRYHTDVPFSLAAECRGAKINPDRELWRVVWRRGGERSSTVLIGAQESQFELSARGWQRTVRGVETRVVDQARNVLGQGTVVLKEERRGRLVYTFRPAVPLLDPTGTKPLAGVLEIESKSGLPLRLSCSDSMQSAEWELTFGGFNQPVRVVVPFVVAQRLLAAPIERLGRRTIGVAVNTIEKRLADLGWLARLRRVRGGLELVFDQERPRRQVELLLSAARVEVWQAAWLSDSLGRPSGCARGRALCDSWVLPVGDDVARKVVLEKLVAANPGIEAEPDISLPVEPKLTLSLPGSAIDTVAAYALVIDGKVLSVTGGEPGQKPGTLRFTGLGNEAMVRLLVALANHEPLPTSFNVVVVPEDGHSAIGR